MLSTRAARHGDGYRLYGTKTHSIFAKLADSALCLARDDNDALTLFLVPLTGEGVGIEPIPALMDDNFHEVTLNGVTVGAEDVVGDPGQGWAIVVKTLAYERTGLDYYVKALRWHRAATERMRDEFTQHDAIGLARLNTRLVAAGTLVRRVLTRLDRGELNEDEAAAAKWYTTELAAEIAWWAAERGGDRAMIAEEDGIADPLDVAAREAPGMRISGGTSEMMLETLARLRLDSGVEVRP
ncbi:acyl-CoA dehydrogenase family protein [Streptosporangium lutulentum]